MSAHRYLLTGGGTGGHVYPAIAMADALREQEPEATFLYVGVRGKAEEKIVPARGYEIAYVESEGWPGSRPSLRLLRFGWTLVKGVWQALDILRKYRPDVIVATGGYVSAPIMLAWLILKRLRLTQAKTFVHEQNLVPGRLNRLIGNVADHVGVSFTESRRYLPRAEMLGYPVRREMVGKEQGSARAALKIPEDAKVILAFGGSQGARTINRAVVDALPRLLADEKVWVIHGVGRMNSKAYRALEDTQQRFFELGLPTEQKQRYKMLDYLDPIEDYYAAADLVIGRGGAGTLAEMALCGLSALLIPKANLPGDHQVRNARALQDKQAAALVYEHAQQTQEGLIEVVEGEVLAERVLALLDAPEQRASMREQIKSFGDREALARIVGRIQAMARGDFRPPKQEPYQDDGKPVFAEMTGRRLVSYVKRHGLSSVPETELEYLTYRTDGYLTAPSWQMRNLGVKLVGLLQLKERLGLVIYLLRDKRLAPRWQRRLGGDYMQVGFLRRNALHTLTVLGVWNEEVRSVFLEGLSDRYFEVRTSALKGLVSFLQHVRTDQELCAAVVRAVDDSDFEVRREAILAMGVLVDDPVQYERLRAFEMDPNWRIREAVLIALCAWVERGVIQPERLRDDLEQFLLTSTGFVPHFQIRERMLELSQAIAQKASSKSSVQRKDGGSGSDVVCSK